MVSNILANVWEHHARQQTLSPHAWELLLGQARQSRLLARLAYHYRAQGWLADVPESPRQYLEGGLRLAERQRHEVMWEIDCITRALNGLDIQVVLLKGAAYLASDLPPARGRLFADIDIMVPRAQMETVEGALFAAGWLSDEQDPYNQRYYREWMHEIPPLRHVQRNTYIDLHHTITPPTSRFHVDGKKLMARAQALTDTRNLHVLAPEDMVLHSAVHLFQEGEFGHGLRDLLDLNDLLLHFGGHDGFWDKLLNRAEELRLHIPLFHALFHIKRLLRTTPPPHICKRIELLGPNKPVRILMGWLLNLALRPMHPSCDSRWTPLARWLLYVRSHAIRMPMRLVLPHLLRKAWMRRFPKVAPPQG